MPEQNKKLEDAFNKFFNGAQLKNALDFEEFCRVNKIVYDGEYEMHYKGELTCYIDTPTEQQKRWRIWTVGDYSTEYDGFPIDERTKKVAWSNVVKCGNCDGCDRDPGKTEVIFGKEFTNVCNGKNDLAMRFTNPDAETLECAKKMVEMTKYAIDNCAKQARLSCV